MALARALLAVGESDALRLLVPHLAGRPERALQDLERFVRGQRDVPEELGEGVRKALRGTFC